MKTEKKLTRKDVKEIQKENCLIHHSNNRCDCNCAACPHTLSLGKYREYLNKEPE